MAAALAITVGIYLIFGALVKPNFFWNSKKAIRLRNSFGDQTAVKIYLSISGLAILIGIFDMLNFI